MTSLITNFSIETVPDGYARGMPMPWWMKMGIKLVLSRVPAGYRFWSKLGVFRHGSVDTDYDRLWDRFSEHVSFYEDSTGQKPKNYLELGPGDSVGRALAAKAKGAEEIWLVDVGDFATEEEDSYRGFKEYLESVGQVIEGGPKSFSRADVLGFCNASYLTQGLKSLKKLPDNTVDLSFSDAVLEHVHRNEFQDTMNELYRVTKPGGVSSHWVDLHDHLGGALNNMRFSDKFWESPIVKKSGFYTNRLLMDEMKVMAKKAGFDVSVPAVHKWETLPTPKNAMDESFVHHNDNELNVCTFLIVLRKT